jgi:hypothetical protein
MKIQQLVNISQKIKNNTIVTKKFFEQQSSIETDLDRKKIIRQKKLLEERVWTLKKLSEKFEDAKKEAEQSKSGSVNTLLGALGLGGVARILKGFKSPSPKFSSTNFTKVLGKNSLLKNSSKLLKGIRGNAVLSTVFAAFDFQNRKSQGQTNLQAGFGAGASAVGGLAGMQAGGTIGAAIGSIIPGPGTLIGAGIGAVLGSYFGSTAGGTISDKITGVDKITDGGSLRQKLEQRTEIEKSKITEKTLFGDSLDIFERILDKLVKIKSLDVSRPQPVSKSDFVEPKEPDFTPSSESAKAPEEVLKDAAEFRKQFPLAPGTPQFSMQPYELQMRENTSLGYLGNDPTVDKVHTEGSAHYDNRAIDIPVNSKELGDKVSSYWRSKGYRVIWNTAGHYTHVHVQWDRGQKKDRDKPNDFSIQKIVERIQDFKSTFNKGSGRDLRIEGFGTYVLGTDWKKDPEDKFFDPTGKQMNPNQVKDKLKLIYGKESQKIINLFYPVPSQPQSSSPPKINAEGGNASIPSSNSFDIAKYHQWMTEINLT